MYELAGWLAGAPLYNSHHRHSRPSSKRRSYSVCQENLWNPEVHNCTYKSSPVVYILSKINTRRTLPCQCFMFLCNNIVQPSTCMSAKTFHLFRLRPVRLILHDLVSLTISDSRPRGPYETWSLTLT
jgi:hypothetical protein